ncbi:hypothetical protein AcW1_009663 [Taiwanofungus camphoratus]|nr:hypothetical protein AcV7_002545 [Antrodia cinnamomea]KAI0948058.1 hypothetical protein AcW1_009663 [Antrodia cinnamomea]
MAPQTDHDIGALGYVGKPPLISTDEIGNCDRHSQSNFLAMWGRDAFAYARTLKGRLDSRSFFSCRLQPTLLLQIPAFSTGLVLDTIYFVRHIFSLSIMFRSFVFWAVVAIGLRAFAAPIEMPDAAVPHVVASPAAREFWGFPFDPFGLCFGTCVDEEQGNRTPDIAIQ